MSPFVAVNHLPIAARLAARAAPGVSQCMNYHARNTARGDQTGYNPVMSSPTETFGIRNTQDRKDARKARVTQYAQGAADQSSATFAVQAARLINDSNADDVLVLDVRGLSELMDFVVIATGTSDRQLKSIGADVTLLGEEIGHERFGSEADDTHTWVVLDFVDVVVHLFEPMARGHYDLEMLWGDAKRVKWRDPNHGSNADRDAGNADQQDASDDTQT